MRGQFDDCFVKVGAGDDAVDHAFEVFRHVLDGLALSHLHHGRRDADGVSAQFIDGRFKAYVRAQRGLLENEHGRFVFKNGGLVERPCSFQIYGKGYEPLDLVFRIIQERDQVFFRRGGRFGNHA